MKKIVLTLGIALASLHSYSQWTNSTDIYNTNSGNVGIGTSSPSAKLDVNGNMSWGNGVANFNTYIKGVYGTSYAWNIDNLSTGLRILSTASGASQFNINFNGNVGIGTTTPHALLQISGTTNSLSGARNGLILDNSNASGNRSSIIHFSFNNAASQAWQLGNDLGANGSQDFFLYDLLGNAARLYVGTTGNVGIGTISPGYKLDVAGVIHTSNNVVATQGFSSNNMQVASADQIISGGNISDGAINVDGNHGIVFGTNYSEKMRIAPSGNVGVGTTNPDEKLTVNGTIHSKKVKVDISVPVPDYVFEPDYKLTDLNEVKSYVDKNHHLPEIPSAAQIAKEGINLGDMNMKLLQKVEELTLYVIQQNERINKLEQQLKTEKAK